MTIPDLYERIEKIINSKEVHYEISENNREYTSIVNEVFFLLLDSILKIITTNNEIYELKENDFFALINANKEILNYALQLEALLSLKSKEVITLQEMLKLINSFTINKLDNVDNIKNIVQYFVQKSNNINDGKELCNHLQNLYKFLFSKLGELPRNNKLDFYKDLSYVFLNEYKQISFNEFRELLLNIILSNNDFIINSSQLFKIILETTVNSDINKMINNFDLIKDNSDALLKLLNNTKNIFLDEVLMNLFEAKVSHYFESISNNKLSSLEELFPKYYNDNEDKSYNFNETGIIFDNSLKIFKGLIEFLDSVTLEENKNDGNTHLCKLYSIVYVKMYLSNNRSY